jgi:hypothetical protein
VGFANVTLKRLFCTQYDYSLYNAWRPLEDDFYRVALN